MVTSGSCCDCEHRLRVTRVRCSGAPRLSIDELTELIYGGATTPSTVCVCVPCAGRCSAKRTLAALSVAQVALGGGLRVGVKVVGVVGAGGGGGAERGAGDDALAPEDGLARALFRRAEHLPRRVRVRAPTDTSKEQTAFTAEQQYHVELVEEEAELERESLEHGDGGERAHLDG